MHALKFKCKIAIVVPCYNEAVTIGQVIEAFKEILPEADLFVIDNNSSDETAQIAKNAGAIVIHESMQGKGFAIRRAFNNIDADIYVLVDGDDTYPAQELPILIEPVVNSSADMVVGVRLHNYEDSSFKKFHKFGNFLITRFINFLFKVKLTDVLSGYRVLSRNFVKTVPLTSKGFELETELTLTAVDGDFRIVEIPIYYRKRPPGSHSKLNTLKDGLLILITILSILKDYRPLLFFSFLSLFFMLSGLAIGIPVLVEFARTGFISKIPSAVLAASLEILSFQMIGVGLVLDTIARLRRATIEIWKKMH